MDWPYAVRRAAAACPGLQSESIEIRLAYSTFVNLSRRYLYFEIPKAATTTMKHLLHSVEQMPAIEHFAGPGKEVRRDMFIHDRRNMKLPSLLDLDDAAQELVLTSPEFMRFTIVRNPYRRLESAWQDKVRLCAPRFEKYTLAIKGALPIGGDPDTLVTFQEFVDSLAAQDLAYADPHWRLQSAHALHGALNFNHVGRLENLNPTLEAFLSHIGEPAPAARRELNRRSRSSAYDQNLAEKVYRLYRADFDEYGYSRDDWPRPAEPAAAAATVSEAEFVDEIVERNLVIGHLYRERDELRSRAELAAAKGRPEREAARAIEPDPRASATARRIDRRLAIIVPYRNRPAHLSRLAPHLISYIRRECAASDQDVKIVVVEQSDDLPFNRGGLLNAGFLAVENEVEYACFHDVDYLPMWADYSYAQAPTRIIW